MNSFVQVLKNDCRFQFRHGFYYTYLFVSVFYIALIFYLPDKWVDVISVSLIFSDPSFLGFFFIGGIILLERNQGIYGAMFVTPFSIHRYLWSKALSLLGISLFFSLLIIVITHGFTINFFYITLSIILLSLVFTFLGICIAVRVHTVNQFLFTSPLIVVICFLPIVFIFFTDIPTYFSWLPSYSGIILMEVGFRLHETKLIFILILQLCCWVVIAYLLAYVSFKKYIVLRIGGGK